MGPYRLAPPRAAESPQRRRRFDPWALWLDVVGAALTIVGLGHARRAHAWAIAKRAEWERAVLDGVGFPRALEVRFSWSGGVLVQSVHPLPALDSHGAPCPANTNACPTVERVEAEAPGPTEIEAWSEAIAADPTPLPFVRVSPAAYERLAEGLAMYLEQDDDARNAAREGGR